MAINSITQSCNALGRDHVARPRLASVSYSCLNLDARVQRQISFASSTFDVSAIAGAGFDTNRHGVTFYEVPLDLHHSQPLFIRRIQKCIRFANDWLHFDTTFARQHVWVRRVAKILTEVCPSVIVANDPMSLSAAFAANTGANVVFDAHEFYPLYRDRRRRDARRRHVARLFQKLLPQASAITTVSPGLQELYLSEFQCKTHLVRNCPYYHNLSPSQTKTDKLELVYHGLYSPERGIEQVVDAVSKLGERFQLHLYLWYEYPGPECDEVKRLKSNIRRVSNVHLNDAMPPDRIVTTINKFDIGLFYFPQSTENAAYCLPNKLMEFIQARLMTLVTPHEHMASLVNSQRTGIVSPDFSIESFITILESLTVDDVRGFKANSHNCAQSFTAENEWQVMDRILRESVSK